MCRGASRHRELVSAEVLSFIRSHQHSSKAGSRNRYLKRDSRCPLPTAHCPLPTRALPGKMGCAYRVCARIDATYEHRRRYACSGAVALKCLINAVAMRWEGFAFGGPRLRGDVRGGLDSLVAFTVRGVTFFSKAAWQAEAGGLMQTGWSWMTLIMAFALIRTRGGPDSCQSQAQLRGLRHWGEEAWSFARKIEPLGAECRPSFDRMCADLSNVKW